MATRHPWPPSPWAVPRVPPPQPYPEGEGVRRDPDFFLRGGGSNTVTRFSTDRVRRPSRPPISSLPPWGRAGVGARVRPSLHNACLVPAFYSSQPAGDACRSSDITAGEESPAGQPLQRQTPAGVERLAPLVGASLLAMRAGLRSLPQAKNRRQASSYREKTSMPCAAESCPV
jgi:hypothetical protein